MPAGYLDCNSIAGLHAETVESRRAASARSTSSASDTASLRPPPWKIDGRRQDGPRLRPGLRIGTVSRPVSAVVLPTLSRPPAVGECRGAGRDHCAVAALVNEGEAERHLPVEPTHPSERTRNGPDAAGG